MSETDLKARLEGDEAANMTSARRVPVQTRSHETVQRILQATSRLLARVALEEITTSRVAQESGVSVGGLYRFFPDKQALIDAVAVQHIQTFESQVRSRLLLMLPLGGPGFLGKVIDSYVEFLDSHPDFRTIVFGRHISAATREQQIRPDVGTAALVKQFMVRFLRLKDTEALSLKLRIATETGDRLLAYAYEQADLSERKRIIDELKSLLSGYLFRSADRDDKSDRLS
jgi:AcrR family transcriptional regulator